MNLKTSLLSFFLLASIPLTVFSEDTKSLELYEAPKPSELITPRHPMTAGKKDGEGWVVINYMVDTNGDVFEPTVEASTGSKPFEKAALKAIKDSKFKPASIDGKSVEGSGHIRYMFSLESEPDGANENFAELYKNFIIAFNEKNKEKSTDLMNQLNNQETKTHYERAFLNYTNSLYTSAFEKNEIKEMGFLNAALLYDNLYSDGTDLLPKELTIPIRRKLFALSVANQRYPEAIKTYQKIQAADTEEVINFYKPTYEKVLALKDNDTAYKIKASTNENGYWSTELYKSSFHIDSKESTINELKLRCSQKYVSFKFEKGNQYTIPKSYGNCTLEILGAANSPFDLVQL